MYQRAEHEVPGDDEEDVHSNEAPLKLLQVEVVQHHQSDGERPQHLDVHPLRGRRPRWWRDGGVIGELIRGRPFSQSSAGLLRMACGPLGFISLLRFVPVERVHLRLRFRHATT